MQIIFLASLTCQEWGRSCTGGTVKNAKKQHQEGEKTAGTKATAHPMLPAAGKRLILTNNLKPPDKLRAGIGEYWP